MAETETEQPTGPVIEDAHYNEAGNIIVTIDGMLLTVPDNKANRHRQLLAQWEQEGNSIALYAPTVDELRAAMPRKSSVEFRAVLRRIRTDAVPEGIYADDIMARISLIADRDVQEEALDYFERGSYFERSNAWVDILGAMFGLTPEDIDYWWMA